MTENAPQTPDPQTPDPQTPDPQAPDPQTPDTASEGEQGVMIGMGEPNTFEPEEDPDAAPGPSDTSEARG